MATALLLDPAGVVQSPLGKDAVKNYPAPEVSTTLGKLAATERVTVLACGTSWHAALVGKFMARGIAQERIVFVRERAENAHERLDMHIQQGHAA